MSSNAFGHLLLRLRVEARRTQEEQAAAINAVSGRDTMTRREVSRYENGQNIPTNHTVTHIAMACGLPPTSSSVKPPPHGHSAGSHRRSTTWNVAPFLRDP